MTKNQLFDLIDSISDEQNPYVEDFLYDLHHWSSFNYDRFTINRFIERMKWKAERYLQIKNYNKSTCYFEVAKFIKQHQNQSKNQLKNQTK